MKLLERVALSISKHYGRYQTRRLTNGIKRLLAAVALAQMFCIQSVLAQTVSPPQTSSISPINLRQPVLIAQQGAPIGGAIPTDVTPSSLGEERELVSPGFTFRLFQKLPERLWFNVNTEVSQRLETNVFFTTKNHQPDYVFRALPNVTLGYNILDHTSIYCNWFLIKDVFMQHNRSLTFPTTQSLSLGFRQDIPMGRRTNLQLDFQARELWQTRGLRQADLIPGLTMTHVLTPSTVLFGNVQLQMRGRHYFVAPSREIDPFYTIGIVQRWKKWTFSATDTLVTNFRSPPFNRSIPLHGNASMIADFEAAHPLHKKLPGLSAFIRAEPIWNWSGAGLPGLSGFDFRLFGGVRLAFGKPSLGASINKLREQLLESEGLHQPQASKPQSNSRKPTATTSGSGPSEHVPGAMKSSKKDTVAMRGPIELPDYKPSGLRATATKSPFPAKPFDVKSFLLADDVPSLALYRQ